MKFLLVATLIISCIAPGLGLSYCFAPRTNLTACTCDPNATCKRSNPIECECNAGYVGDGLKCYTPARCGAINCCDPGYEWNSTCCDQKFCSPACAKDEKCLDSTRQTSCICNPSTYANSGISDLVPLLFCQSTNYKIAVSKCLLDALNLNSSSVHLRDATCRGSQEIIGSKRMVSVSANQNILQCGTTLSTNGTHALFSNTLYIDPAVINALIYTDGSKNIPFFCAYPLDMKLSLLVAINPILSSTTLTGINGSGVYTAKMSVFQYSNFTSPYPAGVLSLPVKTPLYIGAFVDDASNTTFALVMNTCYATPTNSSTDPNRYVFIQNGCPLLPSPALQIIDNGVEPQGLFSLQLVKFVNSDQFFVSCNVHLCDKTQGSCVPVCSAPRSSDNQGSQSDQTLTIGPFNVIDGTGSSSSAPKDFPWIWTFCFPLMLLVLNRI